MTLLYLLSLPILIIMGVVLILAWVGFDVACAMWGIVAFALEAL